jgi:tetratricopeptide (TPR) repeat protein
MEKFQIYAASLALVLPLIAVEAHPPTQSPAELIYRSGETLINEGKYAEAETFLREAIAGTTQSSEWLAAFWTLLSSAHYNQGHIADAEKCLDSSLSAAERVFGRDSIWALSVKNSQSSFLIDTGRLAEAEAILRPAIAAGEKLYGADHAVVVGLMNRLGIVLQKSGNNARAEPLFRRLLAVAGQANLDRRISAELHHNLGALYAEDGRLAMARRHIEEALAIWREVVPADNFSLVCGQNTLVYVLLKEGHLREAHDLARKTSSAATSLFGARQPLSLTALGNLSYVLARMGRRSEALTIMDQAIPLYEETYGPESPILAELLRAYAGVLRKVGRRQEAKQAEKRANAVISR